MQTKKKSGVQKSIKPPVWTDPDDAPELDEDFFARAELVKDGKVIQRGRPPLGAQPKTSVTLRLDAEIVAAYRRTGAGWQSRINADLRKTAKRLKA